MDPIERYKKLLDRYISQYRMADVSRVLHRMAALCEQSGETHSAAEYRRRAEEVHRTTPGLETHQAEESILIPFKKGQQQHPPHDLAGSLVTVDFRRSHLLRTVYGDDDTDRGFICYTSPVSGHSLRPAQGVFALSERLKSEADSARRTAVWFMRRKLWNQAESSLLRAIELTRELKSDRALAYSLWLYGTVLLKLEEDARLAPTVIELYELAGRINRPSYRYLSHLLQLQVAIATEDPLHIALAFATFMESSRETDRGFIYRHPPYRALKSVVDFFIATRDFKMAKEAVNQLKILTPDPSSTPSR